MGHLRYESLSNDWSTPKEAKAKVAKPKGRTDDSIIKPFIMPNPANTQPTRLGSGEPFGPEGQLTVRAAAELLRRGVEIAASPMGEREGLIKTTLANYGTLDAGPGHDVGTRPAYSRDKEAEVMGADYSEDDMEKMEPVGHIGEATSYLDDVSGCQNCDDGKCEACRGNFNRAMAHLSRFAEKVGDSDDGDGDDDAIGDPSGEKLRETQRTYEERAHASADLQRDAVRISSNVRGPGGSHLAPMPRRTVQ